MTVLPKEQAVDVLILGAGISGLAAAYTLVKKKPNLRIAVLEARKRIGGRMYTADLGNGLVSEYGAEWIGRTHKYLLKICHELGVPLEPHIFKEYAYLQRRQHVSDPTLSNALQKLEKIFTQWPTVRGKRFRVLDHMSLRKLIAADCTPAEMTALNEMYAGEFGEDIRYVSAVRAVADHLTGGKHAHMDFHIKGGNQKLIAALAVFIGQRHIFTAQEVVKITQGKRMATVECRDGSIWSAKKIICTLPTKIISEIQFQPRMPAAMRNAAKELHYGNIIKIILVFPKRFWKFENYSQMSANVTQYVFHTTQGQRGKEGALCIYATGKRADALAHMSMAQIWKVLKNSFPEGIQTNDVKPIKMFRHSWVHDRFSQGAYAVYHPGEWEEVHRYFGQPYNHIHFSGEYIAKMQGFMEGAAQTGIHAAKEVINELRR